MNGLPARNLSINPLKFSIDITKRGSLQLCLLILTESRKPEKVIIRYEGITQEYEVSWNEWGWAPVTLLKDYPEDKTVDFEIFPAEKDSNLKISKVYFRYKDVRKTDQE